MHVNPSHRLGRAARDERGFAMILAILVLFICGLLVAATVIATSDDVTQTHTYSNQQRAYDAALAGVAAYRNQLSQNFQYWSKCPSETSVAVPGASEETYTYTTLPATEHSVCEPGVAASVIESGDSASGTFRIESKGTVTGSRCGKHACTRSIVATFKHPSFLDYVFVSNYELADPATVGLAAAECEYYYDERKAGKGNSKCEDFPWINNDELKGPFHTNDAADISGKPVFGREGHNDPIEMNEGYYGGTPKINGNGYTTKGAVLLPPTTNAELIKEAGTKYQGRTLIVLKGEGMEVNRSGTTVPFPTNGVVAVENGTGGCSVTYTPFFPSYTSDKECGDVYVKGEYTKPLTIIAENDVIINGNIWTTGGKEGEEPTGTAVLGLIADKYVRLYHPVHISSGACESGVTGKCEATADACNSAVEDSSETYNNPVIKELGGALQSPYIDAAILSTKNSWGVDNYACPDKAGEFALGKITIWGSIAEDWRGRVTCCAAGGDYLKDYKWDSRLENLQPPDFLPPATTSWKLVRETAGRLPETPET